MRAGFGWLLILVMVGGCSLKEEVVLKALENIELSAGNGAQPLLKANAIFYNPNQIRLKVKGIKLEVFIDGKKAAFIDQKLRTTVKAQSEFTIPLEVQLSFKEIGLFDALAGIFGGKQHELHYTGYIKVSVRGVPLKIPVDYSKGVKLRI